MTTFFIATGAVCTRASALICINLLNVALAQGGLTLPTTDAVLNDAPPAVRQLLRQASAIESNAQQADSAWQTAVLYCQAARWGSAEGQYRLGMLYAFGQGVPESRTFAAALFSLAATLGHAQAQQMLDSIELTSVELPACVNHDQLPEKAPALNPCLLYTSRCV